MEHSPSELVKLVQASDPVGQVRVVAIDGGAAAGKSTMAAALSQALPASAVLHLDDLLDGWSGQFDYRERLHAEVLQPLATGRPGRYRRYDWLAGRFAEAVDVPVPQTLLVEGVSAIWGCGDHLALGIFLDRPRAIRLQRWVERDGPVQPEWLRWLDAEDAFFDSHPVPPATVLV
ncbi:MAG TPA: hypothetical protein VHO01_03735 [Jatrophihabitans sp.]|nr:hypothetical protein [Jatrophihabitans sp.]